MVAILTAAEMRALEQAAIASGEVSGLELMERAGRGVVEAILAEWPDIERGARRAVALCGPGNNGGDGFVVARLLKERGWQVEAFLYGDAEKLPPDAKTNHDRWAQGAPVSRLELPHFESLSFQSSDYPPGSLVIDALFGIGLTRPLEGFGAIGWWTRMCSPQLADAASQARAWPAARVVALDVPSGLAADSGLFLKPGEVAREHEDIRADLTVTFHTLKPGHLLADGPAACGRVRVVDIGLVRPPQHRSPASTLRSPEAVAEEVAATRAARDPGRSSPAPKAVEATRVEGPRTLPFASAATVLVDGPFGDLGKGAQLKGHKYSHGHALLLSGGCGRGGAARLAARGALRIGAGLVTLAVPPAALQENAARLDAVMLRSVRDGEALADLLSDARFSALAAGPGLGLGDREVALLHALLDASRGTGKAAPPREAQGSASDPRGTGSGIRPVASPSDAEEPSRTKSSDDEPAVSLAQVPGAVSSDPARADGEPDPPRHATPERRSVVLDADAVTLLARHPDLRAKLHPACVLTPHEGEFARLFPAIAERLHAPATTGPAYSKLDAARDAAREAGCVVLLKGPDTVIAAPDGRAAINAAVYDRAAPWLATAGSGDVLAGFIAGLLARGFVPFDAACTAAWLHVECARSFGPGLIAEDLPEELPKVLRAIL